MSPDITVLFVDDDAALRDITAETLERLVPTITVSTESTPTAVSERLAEESLDCIVSDYQMPRMDGLQLCEQVRSEHPDIPFFLFTSIDDRDVIEEALASGATDYIWKAPGIEHYKLLGNRIVNAVQHYRLRNRLVAMESEV